MEIRTRDIQSNSSNKNNENGAYVSRLCAIDQSLANDI